DVAATDDDQTLWHLLKDQGTGGGENALLIDLQPRQLEVRGARGDDDVLRGDAFAADVDRSRSRDAARALQPVDLGLLEGKLDALDVGFDHAVLVSEHAGQIE